MKRLLKRNMRLIVLKLSQEKKKNIPKTYFGHVISYSIMNLDESMKALIISEISRNCNYKEVNEYMSTKYKLKSDKLCTSVCICAYEYIHMYVCI